MKLKSAVRIIMSVIATALLLCLIPACFPSDDPDMSLQWKEKWLTPVKLIVGGDVIIDMNEPEKASAFVAEAGSTHVIKLENDSDRDVTVIISNGEGAIEMKASRNGVSALEVGFARDYDISRYVALVIEDDGVAYTREADALAMAAKESRISDIVMMSDADVDGDIAFEHPVDLVPNGFKLGVSGVLSVNTEESGTVAFWNTSAEQISVGGFYVDAPACDLIVKTKFYDHGGKEEFYHTVKTYNGQPADPMVKRIENLQMLEALCDEASYPKLREGMTVSFAPGVSIGKNSAAFSVPVNFVFEGSFSISSPITVSTDATGKIDIKNLGGNQVRGELFDIYAPLCELTTQGCSINIYDVLENMRVSSFNGMDLSDCVLGGEGEGFIESISMLIEDNRNLSADVTWRVEGNYIRATVSCVLDPDLLNNANLSVEAENGIYTFNDACLTKDGYVDLMAPAGCFVTVTDANGATKRYAVITEYEPTKLPVIVIDVEGDSVIDSLTEYKRATIKINSKYTNGEFPSLETSTVNIRGRGNSTWGWEKKPYKLKFDSKTSVLGMTANKDWTLLANYADKSLIRNTVALNMAHILDGMPFATSQYPVDLFVNGEYLGVYTLGEQIEVKEDRVDIEVDLNVNNVDTGYLLQIGGTTSEDTWDVTCFYTKFLRYVKLEEPEDEYLTRERVKYIKEYCIAADNAVMAGVGYEEYIDVDALIDWVILHELTYNLDSCFHRSVYIVKQMGGKLQMGPAWDFDLALGNMSRDYGKYDIWVLPGEDDEDAYIKLNWLNYLYYNEDFCRKMEARWNEVKDELLYSSLDLIDELYEKVAPSAEYNFKVWDILGKKVAFEPSYTNKYDTYEKQIGYLRDFIQDRWTWIDENVSKLPMVHELPATE